MVPRLMLRSSLFLVALGGLTLGAPLFGQDVTNSKEGPSSSQANSTKSKDDKAAQDPNYDPRNRQLSDKEKKERQKALKEEQKIYSKWMDEDVRWIITDEERAAFKQLSNNEEKDQFIEQFWLRRDPTPDTPENEYKDEHYRRIQYANEHFPAGIPGWKTDRGRMYIMYGPPDSIDSHPSGGTYQRPQEEGGGTTSTFPFETWRYRYLEGIGQEIEIEFVDTCMCNDYHMTIDRSEKDALLHTPNGGLTDYEAMGLASKADRFTGGLESLGQGPFTQSNQSKQFDRLETFAKLNRAPTVKFKDLEEVITTKIHYNVMPFDVRADFVKVTSDTVLVPFTVQIKKKDITFKEKEGVQRGTVNILGRITTLTGKIAQTFEDTVQVDVPSELLAKTVEQPSVYWKAVPLRPGRYRVDIVTKDVNGDRVGTWSRGIMVPDLSDDKGLSSSTLILADQMEKVPSKQIGEGNFVIGNTKLKYPRVDAADGKPASFKRNQRLNFWMQVYNLGIDDKTKKSSATVEYDIVNSTTKKSVVQTTESTDQMGNVGDQMTLEKSVPLASLEPGTYELTIKVNDKVANQKISPQARFVVE
ncbi:MAG TPA: GWxTD domain-containing protein [Terriglobales bacterium]